MNDALPLRVLVVDDSKAVAKTLGWMLEAMGYDYRLAHNGEDALTTARDFVPNVILLDIGLQDMSGYEVCRALQTEPKLKDAILIAQTGWSQPEHKQRSKEAGFHHHLVKPVTMDTLEQLFQTLA